jgi:hypothetical protein
MMQEKIYLSTDDLENQYGLKKSFQAKYRTVARNPMPYTRPAGSRVVLYRKDKLEKWLEEFSINDTGDTTGENDVEL